MLFQISSNQLVVLKGRIFLSDLRYLQLSPIVIVYDCFRVSSSKHDYEFEFSLTNCVTMYTECKKCHEHLTHLENVFQCSICNNQIHYYYNEISEANLKKMSKNTKAHIMCTICQKKKKKVLKSIWNQ